MPQPSSKQVIAINARWLLAGRLEGTGWYTWSILERLVRDERFEWHLLFDRQPDPSMVPQGATAHVVLPPARHPWLWTFWNEWAVPRALKRIGVDVYWSVDGLLPSRRAMRRVDMRSITLVNTIHDLNFLHHPEWVPALAGRYYRRVIARSAREADQLFTVSETTRRDLALSYALDADQIEVTYNAPQRAFEPLDDDAQSKVRKQLHPDGKPYLLFVGAMTARKNLMFLVNTWRDWVRPFTERGESAPFDLRIVGNVLHSDDALQRALTSSEGVILHGRAEGDELNDLYGAAKAFVFPSLFEGFGIPIVEAMSCGCPVISSHASCMPEIVSDAGVLLDPSDAAAWMGTWDDMAQNSNWGSTYRERGLKRAADFSWDRSAQVVLNYLTGVQRG